MPCQAPSPECQRNGCRDAHDERHEAVLSGDELKWFYRRLQRYYRRKFDRLARRLSEAGRRATASLPPVPQPPEP